MTKAFDLALFVGTPANPNDAPVIDALGPPFTAKFASIALTNKPGGVNVYADMPAATKANQIMLSGSAAGFPWGLADNPAAAATVPIPGAPDDVLQANATPAWSSVAPSVMLAKAGAVTNQTGATFAVAAKVTFTPAATLTTRLDGGDPLLSKLDNFSWDAGTF